MFYLTHALTLQEKKLIPLLFPPLYATSEFNMGWHRTVNCRLYALLFASHYSSTVELPTQLDLYELVNSLIYMKQSLHYFI